MNHSSRRRGELRSDEEVKKEEDMTIRITAAWETFIKARRGWRDSGKPLAELLDYSSKLLALLGEASSVFNFRQDLISEAFAEILRGFASLAQTKSEPPAEKRESEETAPQQETAREESFEEKKAAWMKRLEDLIKNEMEMLVGLAMRDPKCYQIWHHRKWMFEKIWEVEKALKIQGTVSKKCVAMDIKICDKFLTKDERNFHAWNYRCFLIKYLIDRFPAEALATIEQELKFLHGKLEVNFSNYSAIHFKTKYLILREQLQHPQQLASLSDEQVSIPWTVIAQEVDFCKVGLFIAPYEQSLWIYLSWLLSRKKVWAVLRVVLADSRQTCATSSSCSCTSPKPSTRVVCSSLGPTDRCLTTPSKTT